MYFKYVFGLLAIFSLTTVGISLSMRTHTPDVPTPSLTSTTSPKVLSPSTAAVPKPVAIKPKPRATQKPATSSSQVSSPSVVVATTSKSTAPSDGTNEIEMSVHTLVNAERTKAGLATLSYDGQLATLARGHSADMLAKNYFDHTDLSGCDMTCRFKSITYSYWAIGENIYTMTGFNLSAEATAEKIVEGWMQSPGHRANILNTSYTTEGIGVVSENSSVYATEDFAKPRP